MIERIIFLIISLLFAGNGVSQHTYGSFYTHDAFINYILSKNRIKNEVIVMVPGANLSTYLYVTTPDGRKGWADLFADKGYDVYMVNDPRYDFATGGFVKPYTVPADGKKATPGSQQGWQNDIWSRWGFGSSQGNPYPNALFPTDSFELFARNYPYLGTSNESYTDAIQAVIDSTKSDVWLLAHSAGSSRAVTAARQKKDQVKGLILIEPAGPPDTGDFPDLNGLHMLGMYGDYITSRNQTSRKLATEAAAVLFQKAGGVADVVSLPEDSLVFGNSHILMQDLNSEYVFNIIEHWLRQFSISTGLVEKKLDKKIIFNLYPNPADDVVWIDNTSMNGLEYEICTTDGRILKESLVLNQKIDLSGTPNGLLLVKFKYREQIIMKKIIKKGIGR
ncbi:MAG: T9SS type A sorting domain-containing protein [Saprospiraceae bacterium]|nr:T9SS type A sorting domain-containing protein [Saprospiraceae bacterium]